MRVLSIAVNVPVHPLVLAAGLGLALAVQALEARKPDPGVPDTLGPVAVLASPDGDRLYVATGSAVPRG